MRGKMIDISEDKPYFGEMVLAALTFDKDTKSFSDGIDLLDIADWEDGTSHTVFTRNQGGMFAVTPLQWRPEYADIVSHWMPYPENPMLVGK